MREELVSKSGRRIWLALLLTVAGGGMVAAQEQAGQAISYTRDIRPILATNCFPCHGPDENTREADLRLDTAEGATEDLGGHQAIAPGKPDESEILVRIMETDPDLKMPPPESHKTLKPARIELLRNWIAQGAKYEQHWAFVAPTRPAVPELPAELSGWSDHPIDRFIAERLKQVGLAPAAPADPEVLVRRLYIDLIGLPPSIEEAKQWTARLKTLPADSGSVNAAAYGELVDHLLASPHYGEHWARRWLDLARYADTNGYEKDRPRDIWPYRDWVIRAFNQDMPFGQFSKAQIAGDLIGGAGRDAVVATGFHRNTMLNEEGGIDPLEYRFYAMNDRVATTGTTWLGLTVGCAQCHTHKYDPITHTNYYQLYAIFNNTEEPDLELPSEEQLAEQAKRGAEAVQLEQRLAEEWPVEPGPDEASRRQAALELAFSAWLDQQQQKFPGWQSTLPKSATSPKLNFVFEPDDSVFVVGDITKDDTYKLRFGKVPAGTTAVRLEVLPDDRLPGRGPGLAYFEGPKGDFFLGEIQMVATNGEEITPLPFSRSDQTYANDNFGGSNSSAQLALDGNPETGWSCAGRFGERNAAVFQLERPLNEAVDCELSLRFGRHYPCSLGKFRISFSSAAGEVPATIWSEAAEKLLARPRAELTGEELATLRTEFLMQATEVKAQADRIRDQRRRPGYQKTLVMRERPHEFPRPTYRHHRGEFLSPKEEVQPDVPGFLPPMTRGQDVAPRAAFADWLLEPNHPLTWRVLVNRQWSALFGRGLVTTEGDFGLQGETPSHPELLDWLSVEFVERGQSMKQFHKLLVMSKTYQLSSGVTPEQLKSDPQNRWLSRANRKRLTAEQVRDLVLAASGVLNPEAFGPPVYPPQPEGATEIAYGGASWTPSPAPARFRRGVYTFMKRTAPFAMFTTFDGPSGEVCLAQRESSNTPLQSLTLLNDPVVIEAAQYFGKLLNELEGDDRQKVEVLFERVLTRGPRAEEADGVLAFLAEQRRRLAEGELDPAALTSMLPGPLKPTRNEKSIGEGLPTPSGSEARSQVQEQAAATGAEDEVALRREIAAWALTARAILNLDETIVRN
jgi:mono/diheme cytochrome c family protein